MRLLNLNENIKVKLTEQGKEILIELKKEFYLEQTDSDGYNSFQLHTFMQIFGKSMTCQMGFTPFEGNNIMIDETKLR